MMAQCMDDLRARFPSLSDRTRYKLLRAVPVGEDIATILSMRDDELLASRGFGPQALAEFRAVCPVPVHDPWREHAEMVAGVR